MSLYNDASLVMIPSAYKDGKLYSIKPTDGSGDFTFSRGSNLAATRVDENGLIEKGRENLFLQSNQFDTIWTSSVTLTSGQNGYDGSSDAWLLTKTASGPQSVVAYVNETGIITMSVYAKANSTNWLRLTQGGKTAYFDLQNGVIGSTSNGIDQTITSVGNGWYRCTLTANKTTAGQTPIYPYTAEGDASGSTDSIYIQDAQLEAGLVATDYIETTTTTAQAGILEDMPRLDYSGGASCPSLLLEPTRTNSVVHSEYYGTWIKNGVVVEQNQIISPDGSLNGAKFQGDGTNSPKMLYTGGGSVTSGITYTWSAFVKKGTLNFCQLLIGSATFDAALFSNFDLLNGTIGSNGGGAIPFIESYGNDWYRVGITATANANGTATPFIVLANSATMGRVNGFATSDYIYIYGASYESGSYPTSYIPCYGAATTRSADTCFNSTDDFAGTDQVTLFAELDNNGNDRSGSFFRFNLNQGTSTAEWIFLGYESTNSVRFYVRSNSSTSVDISAGNYGAGVLKMAAKIDSEGNYKLFANGVQISSGSNAVFSSSLNRVNIGQTNGITNMEDRVKQLAIFPTALTDSECIALTTI